MSEKPKPLIRVIDMDVEFSEGDGHRCRTTDREWIEVLKKRIVERWQGARGICY